MDVPAGTAAYAAIFDRATGARLEVAERFVRSLPRLLGSAFHACDLACRPESGVFAVVAYADEAHLDPGARARLEFWCARAGVRLSHLTQLPEAQRRTFEAQLQTSERKLLGLWPDAVLAQSARFFTEVGAPPDRKLSDGVPQLLLDVNGTSWEGVQVDVAGRTVFVPGLSPARGDEFRLLIRWAGVEPIASRVRVREVRSDARSGEGLVGFTLELLDPTPALEQAVAGRTGAAPPRKGAELRVFQRYDVKAPVVVSKEGEAASADVAALFDTPPDPFPAARVEYDTEQELAADLVENVSQGGAFIRTSRPSPVGTRLSISMSLPTGDEIAGPAVVVAVKEHGMGVRFDLPPEAQQVLASALAQIAARPRRALVVDDEELVRRMLADALQQRGFEVLTAADGAKGLSIVTEELLELDLLVTDLRMPHMDGQSFIRTIRNAGGEADLAIVVVTGHVEGGIEKRLEREGADAVLDKELGPELIAQAADAVLERKRNARKK